MQVVVTLVFTCNCFYKCTNELYLYFKHLSVWMLYFTIKTFSLSPRMQFCFTPRLRDGLQEKLSRKQGRWQSKRDTAPKFPKECGQQHQLYPSLPCRTHQRRAESWQAVCVFAAMTKTYSHERKMSEGTNRWAETQLRDKHMGKCLLSLNRWRHTKNF